MSINEILLSEENEFSVEISGWVRNRRGSKNVAFISLNDGSTIKNIQVVAEKDIISEDLFKSITSGACLNVKGTLVRSRGGEQDKEILLNTPVITENLSPESTQYFNQVKELLENNGIDFTIDHKLVRGLDYYTDTAFEFQTNEDKRQNAILAGGRYDKLISLISSRDIPGIGWAAGVERLMSLINIENQKEKKSKVLFAVQNEKYLLKSEIIKQIYDLDCIHETKINKNIKKIFTYADKNNFNFILLIGEEEDSKNKIILKNLNTKEQKIFNQSDIKLVNEIR